jgi:hypothetical protein
LPLGLVNAHRNFHRDLDLYEIFNDLKYKKLEFDLKTDLGTDKERKLNNFIDFMNAVEAAVSRKLIDERDLAKTTIGFAKEQTKKSQKILDYILAMEEKDHAENLAVEAWGFLFSEKRRLNRRT